MMRSYLIPRAVRRSNRNYSLRWYKQTHHRRERHAVRQQLHQQRIGHEWQDFRVPRMTKMIVGWQAT